jgi:hypothetical protein
MKNIHKHAKLLFRLALLILCTTANVNAALWVSGYYPGYRQCDNLISTTCDQNGDGVQELMPPSEIDFTTVTHVMHFAATPGVNKITGVSDIDMDVLGLNATYSSQMVAAAHTANRKVILSVGGLGQPVPA